MVKKYDGMMGYVEDCYAHATKGWLHIASSMPKIGDLLSYEQLGVFEGNTEGIRPGALIQIWFKKEEKNAKWWFMRIVAFPPPNIASFKLIVNGPDERGAKAFVNGWLRFFGFKQSKGS